MDRYDMLASACEAFLRNYWRESEQGKEATKAALKRIEEEMQKIRNLENEKSKINNGEV